MEAPPRLTGCEPALHSEVQRLALLHSLELLDTPPEAAFDAITQLAQRLTGRPVAVIGLVDADRVWFKSRIGLDAAESPRAISLCHAAIRSSDIFEVEDARRDPRFAASPLVTDEPHVCFYAGLPLVVAGLPMGTVCVIDHVPYRLDEAQRDALRHLRLLAVELLERRLASQAKREFIGHMNHEMRTPLNAIIGFSQLLQLGMAPGSAAAGQVRRIADAGHHLLSLVDESLDLLRLESGVQPLQLTTVDVVPVLAEVAGLVRPMAAARDIEMTLSLPARMVVRADARRARQVLINLASNAIKYSEAGSTVRVTAGDEAEPWVEVSDQGAGLSPEQIGRLFTPFERLGRERGDVEGTGLGLALSQRLAEAMGGRITVRSEVGQGARFRVYWSPHEVVGSH